jgi:hypothetical protein
VELPNKEIGHRGLLTHPAGMARDREKHVTVDDHGLILNEDAIWEGVVSREHRDLNAVVDEGLAVRLVLRASCGHVRRP